MTKKDICTSHKTIATYCVCSFLSVEIKTIRHGIDYDSVYYVSHVGDENSFHKSRIYNDVDETEPYFMWETQKVRLSECMSTRM